MIKLKFKCLSVSRIVKAEIVKLIPSMGGNKNWSNCCPEGELRLLVTNMRAFGNFTPGKEYCISISEDIHREIK